LIKIVVLDLDGTLWDHLDASSLVEPLKLIDYNIVVDGKGERLSLNPHVRWFLENVSKLDILLATASWNNPTITIKVLELLGVKNYFQYLGIEPHPHKYRILLKIMKWYKRLHGIINPREILYVDDRRIHLDEIHRYVGDVLFLQMWKDITGFRELYEYILLNT